MVNINKTYLVKRARGVYLEEEVPYKLKVCLVGDLAVGKTCLVKKYVFDEFADSYKGTIGAKVSKKEIRIVDPLTKGPTKIQLLIWDIMGHQGFRKLLQQAYFTGAQGIVAVCDTTREETLSGLDYWLEDVHDVTREIPTVFLGNKCDLVDTETISLNEINSVASNYEKSAAYLSSAKTGHNVDLAFGILSARILENFLKK